MSDTARELAPNAAPASNYWERVPAADRRLKGQAEQLAAWTSEEVPPLVASTEQLLEDSKIWYLFNRNEEAFNCKQAARVRRCLGQNGILLERELKSFLGFFVDEAGMVQKVAVHCRATDELDQFKIKNALGITSELKRLENSSDGNENSPGLYGLVNPFALEVASLTGDVTLQVFDEALFSIGSIPPTVMTNASDRKWSVEFQINDIGKVIPARRLLRADVVKTAKHGKAPTIGIVTGNSPESGALLWERLTKNVRELREKADGRLTGDIYLPKVLLRSVPAMGMTMELHLRDEQVWKEISREIEALCVELRAAQGDPPNVLAIACNTTPYFAGRIKAIAEPYNVRFVSITDAVEEYLDKHSIREFVLLGIGYVHRPEFSGYARLFSRADLTVYPLSNAVLSKIEKLAFDVKRDRPIHECSQELSNLIKKHQLLKNNVVIALTELSLIVVRANWNRKNTGDTQLIDGLEVYSRMLAELFVENGDGAPQTKKSVA